MRFPPVVVYIHKGSKIIKYYVNLGPLFVLHSSIIDENNGFYTYIALPAITFL